MQQRQRRKHYLLPLVTAGYSLLIIYATLFPLSGWQWPAGDNWFSLFEGRPRYLSKADVITNFLVYIPLGLLLALSLQNHLKKVALLAATGLAGATLSVTLESLQLFLPNRISSVTDILMNTLGTGTGVMLAYSLSHHTAFGRWVRSFRHYWFQSGRLADLGLVILGLWALSQLSPLVPTLDMNHLRTGFKPLWHTLHQPSLLDWQKTAVYALYIGGLGFLANTMLQPGRNLRWVFPLFATVVLLLKAPVVGRQVSAEALLGLAMGVGIFLAGQRLERQRSAILALGTILGAFVLSKLSFAPAYPFGYARAFNWMPFRSQIGDVTHLADIITGIWPFMALAYLALVMRPRNAMKTAIWGGLLVLFITFALEWRQQRLPGRYADVTDVLLAAFAWITPWLHPVLRKPRIDRQAGPSESKERGS